MGGKVAITGASGFIGRQAVRPLLDLGFDVHLFARTASSLHVIDPDTLQACQIHEVDLLDKDGRAGTLSLVRPSHLLHFAWHGDVQTRWTSPANLDWAAATLMMAKEFAANGGERMIVCGTCAEYDWTFEKLIEDETPLAPNTLYGAAKANCHRLLMAASEELGLTLAWGHVFFCYGPGEPPGRLMNDVITGLLASRKIDCTPGYQVRDYLHTEDIGRAFAQLMTTDFEGAINVASGTGVRVRDLVSKAAELLGKPELIHFGGKPPPQSEPACLMADITRLKEYVGFRPKYTLEEGLERTIESFRG